MYWSCLIVCLSLAVFDSSFAAVMRYAYGHLSHLLRTLRLWPWNHTSAGTNKKTRSAPHSCFANKGSYFFSRKLLYVRFLPSILQPPDHFAPAQICAVGWRLRCWMEAHSIIPVNAPAEPILDWGNCSSGCMFLPRPTWIPPSCRSES